MGLQGDLKKVAQQMADIGTKDVRKELESVDTFCRNVLADKINLNDPHTIIDHIKVNNKKKVKKSSEIGSMTNNPFFEVEVINKPSPQYSFNTLYNGNTIMNSRNAKSKLTKQDKISKILNETKLENATHVQQKVSKTVQQIITEFEIEPETIKPIAKLKRNKCIFSNLSKNTNNKNYTNNKCRTNSGQISHIGPFSTLKVFSKSQITFNSLGESSKLFPTKINLRMYYKFPHTQITSEKSKIFDSMKRQYQKALESVFGDFKRSGNEFFVNVGSSVILFHGKKAYVPRAMVHELSTNEIEFENVMPIFEINNNSNNLNNKSKNIENITRNTAYLIIEGINVDLLYDHLLNNSSSKCLPFIFSRYAFLNGIVYVPHVKRLGVIRDGVGIKYGYRISGHGLVEDVLKEFHISNECEGKSGVGCMCFNGVEFVLQ